MTTFSYNPEETPVVLRDAIETIAVDFPISTTGDIAVTFELSDSGPAFSFADGKAAASGSTVPMVLRALASLRGFAETGEIPKSHSETAYMETLGLMWDASRGAVPNVATIKFLLRKMALMGMNVLMMYTEDTYEVPGQPFIGYLRGRYSQEEMQELDDYASKLGVEMFPCIQALAHLSQMLRWSEFNDVKDTNDILLVDEPKTYDLLSQMIGSATKPFRSKRVHIGMDEAHGLGTGRYKELHGIQPRFEIMNKHLSAVVDITNSLGLKPMIWSDMYFRLGSKTGDYYDLESAIPESAAKDIPQEVELIYWDYYHPDKEFYLEWIDRHRALGKEPIFAPGLWTWHDFWTAFGKARIDTDAGMLACKDRGVKEAITTAWGDNGNDCNSISMLTALQHFAEHGYNATVEDDVLRRQFAGATGLDFDDWNLGRLLDELPWIETIADAYLGIDKVPESVRDIAETVEGNWVGADPSRYLLWQDPLLGLFDPHVKGKPIGDYYRSLSEQLRDAVNRAAWGKRHLTFALMISEALEDKAELGVKIFDAYRSGDKNALEEIANTVIPRLINKIDSLHEQHRQVWFEINKANGWEIIDGRYAIVEARLKSTRLRIADYLSGVIDRIEELDEDKLPAFGTNKEKLPAARFNSRLMRSPSVS